MSRIDVIGQNGNNGEHYMPEFKAKEYGGPVDLKVNGGGPNGSKGHNNAAPSGTETPKNGKSEKQKLLDAADKENKEASGHLRKKF